MSATGRGASRAENDYYPTPAWCVHRLLETEIFHHAHRGMWLEPAVGRDHAIKLAVNSYFIGIGYDHPGWRTADIDPFADGQFTGDYTSGLSVPVLRPFEVGITNPPYSLAEAFAKQMRKDCRITALLLRINFLASEKRNEWLKADPPDIYVLPNRPSFSTNGRTDATEYAWFVWGQGGGKLKILASTPKAERSRAPNIAQ